MPPRKTIFTDADTIIRSLAVATEQRLAAIRSQLDLIGWYGSGRGVLYAELERTKRGWIPFDPAELAGGQDLTDSERLRWRQEARRVEAAGFVEIDSPARAVRIRLTDDGKRRAVELLETESES